MTTVKMPTDATEAAKLLWFDILNFGNDRMDAIPEVAKFLTQYAAHSAPEASPPSLPPPPPAPDRPLPIDRGTPPRSTRPNLGTQGPGPFGRLDRRLALWVADHVPLGSLAPWVVGYGLGVRPRRRR